MVATAIALPLFDMIRYINLERAHLNENLGMFQALQRQLPLLTIDKLQPYVTKFNDAVMHFEASGSQNRLNSHTPEVQKNDKKLTEAWRNIRGYSKIMCRSSVPANQQIAKHAYQILIAKGSIDRIGQGARTASIGTMISSLDDLREQWGDQMSEFDSWQNDLKTAYAHYKESDQLQIDEKSEYIPGLQTNARMDANAAYYELTQKVNAHTALFGEEDCEQFVRILNEIIDDLHITMAARKTRLKNKKQKKTLPSTQTDDTPNE